MFVFSVAICVSKCLLLFVMCIYIPCVCRVPFCLYSLYPLCVLLLVIIALSLFVVT